MPSIEQAKTYFQNVVRPHQYRLEIFGINEGLAFLGKASSYPGREIGQIEAPAPMGQTIYIPGDNVFEPWEITIQMGSGMQLHRQFETWMEQIKNAENGESATPAEAKQDATVILLGNQGEEIAEKKLVGAWPTSLSAIELGFEQKDAISEFTVSLRYDYPLTIK